jgi:hypothetical protein
MTRLIWNSRISKYHSVRQLSPLSDGSLSDTKRSATYELHLSEHGRVAEFGKIWTNLTFRHKTGFWWNFTMTSLETLYTKNVDNELSFSLVTYTAYFDTQFGSYGLLSQVMMLNCFRQLGHWNEIPGSGAQNEWILVRLITDFAANLLCLSTPTHTYNFGNHCNGYSCSKEALVQS